MVLSEAVPFWGVTPSDWLTEAGGHQQDGWSCCSLAMPAEEQPVPSVELEESTSLS